ncbi:MAG TPA: phosphatase PAP2-related protein [Ignavibacteriaceae bacterium]|nr:phosphatase PAP2-related protein [Ignavibacteriaceae bacterium]
MKWKDIFKNKKSIADFFVTVLFVLLIILVFPVFLNFIELRDTDLMFDPFLDLFLPIDLTWITFGLIYFSVITAIISLMNKPASLFLALQSYGFMLLFRMLVMYLTPLEAPEKLIPLHDPFVQMFGTGDILTKDLFFSGHTATMFVLFLVVKNKILKVIFLITTILVGLAVLVQHVHYTVDVVAAPVFAFVSYKIVWDFKRYLGISTE